MKTILSAALIAVVAGSAAFAEIQPIPGSLTYGNANVHLQKAPAGSTMFHKFISRDGDKVNEVYRVNQDRTVTLVNRSIINDS